VERERKAVAQKNKFPRTKSAAPTQAMCRRCEDLVVTGISRSP